MHGKNLAIIPLCGYMGSFVVSLFINKLIPLCGRVVSWKHFNEEIKSHGVNF